jgi:hypothetical protein
MRFILNSIIIISNIIASISVRELKCYIAASEYIYELENITLDETEVISMDLFTGSNESFTLYVCLLYIVYCCFAKSAWIFSDKSRL